MAATLFIGKAIADNPDASMMIIGGGFFFISYLLSNRITPPPNDNICFLHEGHLEWSGSKAEVLESDNENLQSFIFASPSLQRLRQAAVGKGVKV